VLADWTKERFGAQVDWLPYDLHPEYPPEGVPRHPERSERARQLFAAQGLAYDPPERAPNTMKALRLTELARDRGLHEQFHDRLMDAYWTEAADLGDDDVLRELAAQVGLEGADEVLAGDAYRDRVLASTAQAQSIGITGIPGFLLDGRLLVLGAQPRELFERAFAQLAATDGGGGETT
jgi:predicted DsbA family dithiol-disulfide isomerase